MVSFDNDRCYASRRIMPTSSVGNWIRAATVDNIKPGDGLPVAGTTPPIAVFRSEDGEFFAVDDTCTHQQSSLSEEGYVDGAMVVCGWHMAQFTLRTGEAAGYPADEPLRCYPVEIRDGAVYVRASVG
jgi:3-phenylpropionate/trans-cinnamate dioxygenase ferredoxin subunit